MSDVRDCKPKPGRCSEGHNSSQTVPHQIIRSSRLIFDYLRKGESQLSSTPRFHLADSKRSPRNFFSCLRPIKSVSRSWYLTICKIDSWMSTGTLRCFSSRRDECFFKLRYWLFFGFTTLRWKDSFPPVYQEKGTRVKEVSKRSDWGQGGTQDLNLQLRSLVGRG